MTRSTRAARSGGKRLWTTDAVRGLRCACFAARRPATSPAKSERIPRLLLGAGEDGRGRAEALELADVPVELAQLAPDLRLGFAKRADPGVGIARQPGAQVLDRRRALVELSLHPPAAVLGADDPERLVARLLASDGGERLLASCSLARIDIREVRLAPVVNVRDAEFPAVVLREDRKPGPAKDGGRVAVLRALPCRPCRRGRLERGGRSGKFVRSATEEPIPKPHESLLHPRRRSDQILRDVGPPDKKCSLDGEDRGVIEKAIDRSSAVSTPYVISLPIPNRLRIPGPGDRRRPLSHVLEDQSRRKQRRRRSAPTDSRSPLAWSRSLSARPIGCTESEFRALI